MPSISVSSFCSLDTASASGSSYLSFLHLCFPSLDMLRNHFVILPRYHIKCHFFRGSFLTTLSKIVPLSHCIFLLTLLHNTYFLTWLWNICLFTCLLIVSPLKFKFCLDRFLVIFFYFYNPSA